MANAMSIVRVIGEATPASAHAAALTVGYHRVSAGDYRVSEGLQDALQVQMTNAKNVR